jgi:xanthine dehydrogenase YagS FAD-binding subunit
MNPFAYERASTSSQALRAINANGAKFLGGGTNLVDLMKDEVERPSTLVDITKLDLTMVDSTPGGGVLIGAMVRNSDLANHPRIVAGYPLLSLALLSSASPQLRNMATTGGNLLQRTRCYYFMDPAYSACNKRAPGSGCAAIEGVNRIHAILGQTDRGATNGETCIATNPSDMNVALTALDATVHAESQRGKRAIPIGEFHRLPGTTPQLDTTLRRDELITGIELLDPVFAANSWYLKVRDRQSYAFALVSVAAALEMSGGTIKSGRLARAESRTNHGARSKQRGHSPVRPRVPKRSAKRRTSPSPAPGDMSTIPSRSRWQSRLSCAPLPWPLAEPAAV